MEHHSKFPNSAGIYKFTCINNGKIYIGKSVNLRIRINDHKSTSKKNSGKYYFENALIKYGWESFIVEILETFDNFDKTNNDHKVMILDRETYYIELFDSTDSYKGYNRCKRATDRTGIPLSEETKEKMRQAKLGKTLSEEHKEKMRKPKSSKENFGKSNIGKKLSDETKEKIGNKHRGKFVSMETREKLRQSRLGKKHSEETKEKIKKTLKLIDK